MKMSLGIFATLAGFAAMAAVPIELVRLEDAFVLPDTPVVLTFRTDASLTAKTFPCEVVDYGGATARTLDAVRTEDGAVTVAASFPRGYHELRFPSLERSFGLVALKPFAGAPDPFFGMDAAISGLEQRDAARTALVRALKRSGVSVARERLGLSGYDPQRRVCTWEGGWRVREMRDRYEQAGVATLEMLWGATRELDPAPGGKLPYDYIALGDIWRDARLRIGRSWRGYEVGNEPDLENYPADQYVSVVKGAALAQDPRLPHVPVVGGVFAAVPPGDYFDCARANGILDCSDAISFHQYLSVPAVQEQVAAYRAWLAKGGDAAKPLILSESGHHWPMGGDRPDAAHDIASAAEISGKAVEAKACGLKEFHPFVLVFYEEGGIKNFGMFGREVTPTRQFAAYAFCIRALAGRRYVGDLKGVQGAVRARVFRGADGRCVVPLYTGRAGTPTRVTVPGRPQGFAGADGRRLASADGTLETSDALVYALYEDTPPTEAGTEAMRLLRIADDTPKPLPQPSPVVMQYRRDPTVGRASKRVYAFSKPEARDLPVTVRFQNTGTSAVKLTPRLELPSGARVPFGTFTLAARSATNAMVRADLLSALDVCEIRYVRVAAACTGAPDPIPLALPMTVDGELDEILSRFRSQRRVPVGQTDRWKMRCGNGRHVYSTLPDGTLHLDMKFENTGSSWLYPYFRLPDKIDPGTFCGIVIRARVLKAANGVMTMLVDEKRGYEVWANDLFAADGQWHTVYVPFDGLRYNTTGMQNAPIDFDGIDAISFGCCSHVPENALEIGAFYFVGRP